MAAPADAGAAALAGYPKTVVLLDGAHLLLRPATPADAAARDELRRRAARPAAPEGTPAATVVLALDGERVVGEVGLHRGEASPVAEVAVTLDPAYRGRRLGTWLLLDCVHLATSLGLERLTATAPADDAAYLGALRRLDFVARVPAAGGERRELVKTLHRAWSDF
jgi:RimJ/RimL family protein N-acetyltransferase